MSRYRGEDAEVRDWLCKVVEYREKGRKNIEGLERRFLMHFDSFRQMKNIIFRLENKNYEKNNLMQPSFYSIRLGQ